MIFVHRGRTSFCPGKSTSRVIPPFIRGRFSAGFLSFRFAGMIPAADGRKVIVRMFADIAYVFLNQSVNIDFVFLSGSIRNAGWLKINFYLFLSGKFLSIEFEGLHQSLSIQAGKTQVIVRVATNPSMSASYHVLNRTFSKCVCWHPPLHPLFWHSRHRCYPEQAAKAPLTCTLGLFCSPALGDHGGENGQI